MLQKWLNRELNWGLLFNTICDSDFPKTLPYTNWVHHVQAEDSWQSHISLTSDHASAEQHLEHGGMFSAQTNRYNSTWIFRHRVKLQRLCSVFVADLVYPLILCQSYANPTYLKPHGKRLNRHRHIQAVPTKDMKII